MLDVMVFTAHRRGEYLIDCLAAQNIRFQAFDFSYHLGERDEKDLLGPFGFFTGEQWGAGHKEWLDAHYVFTQQKQGWSVYSDDGTLETTGLVSAHQKELMSKWAAPVGSSFYSTMDYPLRMVSDQKMGADLFSKYYLPWALENPKSKLMNIGLDFRFEITDSIKKITFNQHEHSSAVVMNFLTGTELMTLQRHGMTSLLNGEALRPRQCWQRTEIILNADVDLSMMPLQVLFAHKLEDPWLGDRFFILQRQENDGYYSIWYRTWYERHKSEDHFKNMAANIEDVLMKRIPGAKVQWSQVPFEVEHENAVALYPIFDVKEWSLQNKWLDQGIYNGSTDKLQNYLWSHTMDRQQTLAEHFSQEMKK